MKAVILNAFDSQENFNIAELIAALLEDRGWEHEVFSLGEMDIKPCTSCGHCAVKTSGCCSIKDDMDKIYTGWANCQLLVFCTPISFGGYHSALKIVLDRFMPINTALFTVRRGELHHENRYTPTPSLMTIGLLAGGNSQEQEVFEYLTERNAVNMNIDQFAAIVLTRQDTKEDVQDRMEKALQEVI